MYIYSVLDSLACKLLLSRNDSSFTGPWQSTFHFPAKFSSTLVAGVKFSSNSAICQTRFMHRKITRMRRHGVPWLEIYPRVDELMGGDFSFFGFSMLRIPLSRNWWRRATIKRERDITNLCSGTLGHFIVPVIFKQRALSREQATRTGLWWTLPQWTLFLSLHASQQRDTEK